MDDDIPAGTMCQIPAGTMCQRCLIHPATTRKADSVLDWAHGHSEPWCQCCVLSEWIRDTERRAAKVPQWRAELETACAGQPAGDVQALLSANADLRAQARRQWLAAHCVLCGRHYPAAGNAINYAAPHPPGEHCYWPEPEAPGNTG
jgi:hypothetical protein